MPRDGPVLRLDGRCRCGSCSSKDGRRTLSRDRTSTKIHSNPHNHVFEHLKWSRNPIAMWCSSVSARPSAPLRDPLHQRGFVDALPAPSLASHTSGPVHRVADLNAAPVTALVTFRVGILFTFMSEFAELLTCHGMDLALGQRFQRRDQHNEGRRSIRHHPPQPE